MRPAAVFFSVAVHGLGKTLVPHRRPPQRREAIGRNCGLGGKRTGRPAYSDVADRQLPGIDEADNVAGIGFRHGLAVAPKKR
jgi:hypothetical protein